MNRYKSSILFAMVIGMMLVIQQSCVDHNFPTYSCSGPEPTFQADVKPIIEMKCALSGCHNGDLGPDRNWTVFDAFQEKALHGDVKNFVVNRIMPRPESPNGPLTQEQINTIACWVDAGAKNN